MADFRAVDLDGQAIQDANRLFDWRAVTRLPNGQLLGKPSPGKREEEQRVPDTRIELLDKHVGLAGKSVLEVGCFEGIHTLGLRRYTENVTAIDVRPVNVFKTLARLSMHGADAKVFVADCEKLDPSFGTFDIVFHIGVLYHVVRPVEHLALVGKLAPTLYLDTHIAAAGDRCDVETIDGHAYASKRTDEGGWKDPFSGAHKTARRLDLDSLTRAIENAGYTAQRLVQYRQERNGPRVVDPCIPFPGFGEGQGYLAT
ncbi:MAG: class I SAM-dependent methyltransferase [Terricaulis sp.]